MSKRGIEAQGKFAAKNRLNLPIKDRHVYREGSLPVAYLVGGALTPLEHEMLFRLALGWVEPYLDPTETHLNTLNSLISNNLVYCYDTCHVSPLGHRILALVLSKNVRDISDKTHSEVQAAYHSYAARIFAAIQEQKGFTGVLDSKSVWGLDFPPDTVVISAAFNTKEYEGTFMVVRELDGEEEIYVQRFRKESL